MDDAHALIERLGLAPHPEGGWYRETWRAEAPGGGRGSATAIYFLLEAGQASHWHRVDGWALVSCIVSPAFDFAGFELALPGWAPGR